MGAAAARLQMLLLREEASGFGTGCGRHEMRRRVGAVKRGGGQAPAREVADGQAAQLRHWR